MNTQTFENRVKGLKKEELIKILIQANEKMQQFRELAHSQKLIDEYANDIKNRNNKDAKQTFNMQNKIKEWILSAYDKGQNFIIVNNLELIFIESLKYFYTPSDNYTPKRIQFNKIDYTENKIYFTVILDDFSAKEIEFLNREYSLDLPISTDQRIAQEEEQQKYFDDIFFS